MPKRKCVFETKDGKRVCDPPGHVVALSALLQDVADVDAGAAGAAGAAEAGADLPGSSSSSSSNGGSMDQQGGRELLIRLPQHEQQAVEDVVRIAHEAQPPHRALFRFALPSWERLVAALRVAHYLGMRPAWLAAAAKADVGGAPCTHAQLMELLEVAQLLPELLVRGAPVMETALQQAWDGARAGEVGGALAAAAVGWRQLRLRGEDACAPVR